MPRRNCPPEENVLRAIHSAHWDRNADRKSSSIFKGRDISVSRLSILGVEDLFAIFHRKLDESPNGRIVAAGEINVGSLQKIGRGYEPLPTEITVEEDPEDDNLAHALIPQRISQGLAKVIIANLTIHDDPHPA
jgi:hypothetical protein